MTRWRAAVVAGLGVACLTLAACGSDEGAGLASSRDAFDGIGRLGVDCSEPVIGDQDSLPYTSVSCVGLRIDWIDDADAYRDLVVADCDATPADRRPVLAQTPLVVGESWVLRGADPLQSGSWPRRVTPEQAASDLHGSVTTAADYCDTARAHAG